jgi:predicted ribonuclease toxin of YeeF-YezG toxin-antitoxin module
MLIPIASPKRFDIRKEIQKKLQSNKAILQYDLKFQKYLKEIEKIGGRKLHPLQRTWLKQTIEKNSYKKLKPKASRKHRASYNKVKKEIIADWERNIGRPFPTYDEPVFNKHGEMVRLKGQRYDLHHIILCSWKGDNRWENIVPLRFPDEHQQGIHRKGGICEKIFGG